MKRILLIILVLALVIISVSGCTKEEYKPVEAKEQYDDVQAVKVINPARKDIAITHVLSGKLTGIEDVMVTPELSFPAKVKSVDVKLGEKVSKGQVLFTLDDGNIKDQIEQAQAAYNVAAANLKKTEEQIDNAKINYERMETLYNEGAISKQQYEQSKLSASDLSIDALMAQVNQTKVALDQAVSQLEKTVVKSPIDGYAAAINIEKNEFASSSQPAMRVVNINKLKVDIGVSEQLINKLQKGQEVNVNVKVASDEMFKGFVTAISPVPDVKTQIYPVEVEIDNNEEIVKAGMFAEIVIEVDKRKNVITVPSQAIRSKDGKKYVFSVENEAAKLIEVEVGLDEGKYIEIKSGVSEEDIIIIQGQDYVDDGSKVKVQRGDN